MFNSSKIIGVIQIAVYWYKSLSYTSFLNTSILFMVPLFTVSDTTTYSYLLECKIV